MLFGVPLAVLASIVAFNAQATPTSGNCPDYTTFSQSPQGKSSTGPLSLPFMRPSPECRTFTSPVVERVITDMKSRLKDPDLARLFENTFPNTLDTTVKYFNQSQNLAFIITGDITAQWLRDTANQFAHYHALLPLDKNLATLQRAVINNEARYIKQYPYCGSFQPPPESGLPTSHNDWADGVVVNPPVDSRIVFECKYEIDSLCGFIKLSRSYYENTHDSSFINDNWDQAIDQIFRVIDEQSQPTFDANFRVISFYNWTGGNGALSPAVENEGNGEPKGYTANAMLSVELTHLADMLDAANHRRDLATKARNVSQRIRDAIWGTTLINGVFAYETNGLGSFYRADDANVPSLLSLPYLGFLDRNDSTYIKTREVLLSRQNPYYAEGNGFFGIGGPHVDVYHPWPMSLISTIYGTDDDKEILRALYTIANNTAGLGLIHESQSIYNKNDYTRSWFAWANSYFAEMMLDLAKRKPSLIFKDATPYVVGQ